MMDASRQPVLPPSIPTPPGSAAGDDDHVPFGGVGEPKADPPPVDDDKKKGEKGAFSCIALRRHTMTNYP